MKTATAIARFVLGLVFVVFGLNGFLNFMPMGSVPALAGQFATFSWRQRAFRSRRLSPLSGL